MLDLIAELDHFAQSVSEFPPLVIGDVDVPPAELAFDEGDLRRAGDVIGQSTEQADNMAETQTVEVVVLVRIRTLEDVQQMRVPLRAEQELCPPPNGHPEQPLHRSTSFEEGTNGVGFVHRVGDLTPQDMQPLADLHCTNNPL